MTIRTFTTDKELDLFHTKAAATATEAALALKADKTAVAEALDLKAVYASPVFTGNPTAPTPTAGDNDTSVATTAFVTGAVADGKVSPAFTGNPTAPTALAGDNDTSIATTAFVTGAVADAAATTNLSNAFAFAAAYG